MTTFSTLLILRTRETSAKKTTISTKLRPISEDGGPEVEEWNKIMEPYLGMNWLDTPWLYAEFYAYRRLMEAFSFFKTGEQCHDYFCP